MYNIFKSLSDVLSGKASIFIILTSVVTFFVPELFMWVKGNTQTVILGIIMLTMGLTLTTKDFKVLLSRPIDIFIGSLAQFTIMPFVAYCLSWLFCQIPAFAPYSTAMTIGIILVGCCPGGVSSNIMSYLCNGDVAYSVGMTCASTLLAPVLTPFLVLSLAGAKVEVDAIGMFQQILIVTIIPIAIGFILNITLSPKGNVDGAHELSKKEKIFMCIKALCPGLSVICLACIVGGVVTTVHDPLVENGLILFIMTFCMVLCHNTIGYVLGYYVGTLFKFSKAKKRTISIEVGMQNAGLGTNLAMTFFVATIPMAVVPCAISCAWHSISGTILANFFRSRDEKSSK
ncbi:MAG: bile acid:sodium symporter family protein [Bacteroidaceae bacterium]|nr:bile acid:sodium symporter family protein [Bacteroidaceae bacterium]